VNLIQSEIFSDFVIGFMLMKKELVLWKIRQS